jgi:hypothetical protein
MFVLVLRIHIRRIHMFLGLPDPHPDALVRDTDPSIIKQKSTGTGGAVCKGATPSVEQLGGRVFKPRLRSLLD